MKKTMLSLTLVLALCLSLVLTACGGAASSGEAAPAAKDYAQILFDNRDAEMNEYLEIISNGENGYEFMAGYSADYDDEMKAQMGDMTLEMAGLAAEDMDSYAISLSPMMTSVYCIAIVKPAEGKDEAVEAALQNHIQAQQDAMAQYLQDQYEIAKDARLTKAADGSWVLVMTETADADEEAILAALK